MSNYYNQTGLHENDWRKRLGYGNWLISGVGGGQTLKYSPDGTSWYSYVSKGQEITGNTSVYLQDHELMWNTGLKLFNVDLWISMATIELWNATAFEVIQLPEDVYLFPDFKELLNKSNKF